MSEATQPIYFDGWSGPRVCEEAGISYRQLDYWVRTGMITPSISPAHGSGTRRRFSHFDLQLVRLAKRMLDTGLHLEVVRHVMEGLRDFNESEVSDGVFICIRSSMQGGQHPRMGSQSIYVTRDSSELLRAITESSEPMWITKL